MNNHHDRLRDEHARSHDHLRRFHQENPGFLDDPAIRAMGHHLVTAAQASDLEKAGLYDPEGFRKLSSGRDPTPDEISQKHLEARTHGGYGVRRADQLIHHAAGEIEKRIPGVRRRQPRNEDGTFRERPR